MTPSPYGCDFSIPNPWARCRTSASVSTKDPGSRNASMRSRAVILPLACCFSTARSEPAWVASSVRRRSSASLPAVVCGAGVASSFGMALDMPGSVVGSMCGVGSPYSDLERPPLRVESLTRALVRPGSLWREIHVMDSAPSTNAIAAAAASAEQGLVVVAEHQTAGRGRLDRSWVSPPRAGLTFSVVLRPNVADAQWSWLPLLVGVAAAEAIEDMSGVTTGLKWPNDIVVDGSKLGGMLVERHGPAAVVGVGVNVTTTAAELSGLEATSLLLAEAAVTDRESLLRAILRALADRYLRWCRDGSAEAVRAAYLERCVTVGAHVAVALPGGAEIRGTATGIDEAGHLVVGTADGAHSVASGDVRYVRPQ